jgi:hypothetical protein
MTSTKVNAMSPHLALTHRSAADVQSMRRQLEEAEYLLDRALGRAVLGILGERVHVKPAHLQRPDQKDLMFQIVEAINVDKTKMLVLKDEGGTLHKYFRPSELLPATYMASPGEKVRAMTPRNATDELIQLTDAIARTRRVDLRTALREASRQRPDLAERHLSGADQALVAQQTTPTATGTSELLTLANRIAREQGVSLRAALKAAASRDPVAVERYRTHFNCGRRG